MEKKSPQKMPYVMDMEPGTYAWCACGHSANQPFCDGAHAKLDTGITPTIEKIDAPKKVAWCGCKHSNGGSFCDGSHSKL